MDARRGIYIGNNVNISGELHIYTFGHDIESPKFEGNGGPVYIKDWAYIGTRVTILPNVTIREDELLLKMLNHGHLLEEYLQNLLK